MGDMEVVPLTELQVHLARHAAESAPRPVGVSFDGEVRFVIMPFQDYERLSLSQRVAGRTEDLGSDTLKAIRAVKPGQGSREAEARLNDCKGRG
jgi:hypothetical protein